MIFARILLGGSDGLFMRYDKIKNHQDRSDRRSPADKYSG